MSNLQIEPQLDILIDQTEEASQKLDEIKNAILSGTGSLVASGIQTMFAQAILMGQGTLTAVGKLVSTAVKAIKNISLSKQIRFKNV